MKKNRHAVGMAVAVLLATAGTQARADGKPEKDCIVDGVHLYTPKGYVEPPEPAVREHLEWFKDQKFGLFMHFGLYSQLGIAESWALVDDNCPWWAKIGVDWASGDEFKRQYYGMYRSFNPVRFQPEKWAKAAKDAGFRYLIFTAKHHDGFCLWDTKYTDFKVTNPDCPFSRHPKSDIVRHVFDAFRAEGLGISCYFSKPDWHHNDYWENSGIGYRPSRYPSYDCKKDPARWGRFREFTRNQILELMNGYGKIDVLWLDGGHVSERFGRGLGIRLPEIVAEVRKKQPWLISVDRAVGGPCENFITPECTVPPQPMSVPWESCIIMTTGCGWGYKYDAEYRSVRELLHLLIDVVAKGGNLALNVGPMPNGCLPQPALDRMQELGKWLKANGEAIYATRIVEPFRTKDWAYTRSKDGSFVYAIRLWKDGEQKPRSLIVDCANAAKVKKVVHLGTKLEVPAHANGEGGLVLDLPDKVVLDSYAEAFRLEMAK